MPKIDHIKTSFSGGEFGPSLFGRTDIAQYEYACEIVENFLVRPYGSVISTPGTEFIRECKWSAAGSDSTVRLIPFIFSRTDAYIIEMGEGYFRFYTNGAVVVTTGTTPFELAHIYIEEELADIHFAQKNDIINFFHPDNQIQKLTRLAAANWTIGNFSFLGGPFMDDNTNDAITLSVSNSSGTINITSSAALFTVSSGSTKGHWNTYWKIGGTRTNSTTGLEEQGYVQVTNVVSTTVMTASVIKILTVTGSTTAWAEGAWSDVRGWPARGVYHEGRLFAARTDAQPTNVWGSKTFVYDDFLAGAEDDDGLALELSSSESNDIKWLASSKVLLAGTYGGDFVIKTGDDSPLTPSNVTVKKETGVGSEAIIPKKIGNFLYYVQRFYKKLSEIFYFYDNDAYKSLDRTILSPHISNDGIIDMAYQQVQESILWCVTSNGTLATLTREVDQEVAGWARQVTDGTYESIAIIPSQEGPYDEVWVVVKRTINGTTKRYIERFADITVPDRQDLCWYVHSGLRYNAYDATSSPTSTALSLSVTSGTSCVVTTSATYFSSDDVGQRIRAIDTDGETVGELEITGYTSGTTVIGKIKTAFDALSYTAGSWGLSVSEISGLGHLEAKEVVVLADGGVDKPDKTVSNGAITLAYDYFVVLAGLQYDQTLKTLAIEGGSERGTSQGKIQKINQVALKVNRSHKGFKIGGSSDLLERTQFRDPTTVLGTPQQLFTGTIPNIPFRDDYRYGSQVMIRNEDPLPMEILNIISTIDTQDK